MTKNFTVARISFEVTYRKNLEKYHVNKYNTYKLHALFGFLPS